MSFTVPGNDVDSLEYLMTTNRTPMPRIRMKQPIERGLDFFAFFTSVAGPVCSTGRPQFGHEGAASETSLPQSGHLISAIFKPPYRKSAWPPARQIISKG